MNLMTLVQAGVQGPALLGLAFLFAMSGPSWSSRSRLISAIHGGRPATVDQGQRRLDDHGSSPASFVAVLVECTPVVDPELRRWTQHCAMSSRDVGDGLLIQQSETAQYVAVRIVMDK